MLSCLAGVIVGGVGIYMLMRYWDSVAAAEGALSRLSALYALRQCGPEVAVSRLETRLTCDFLILQTMPQTEIVTNALAKMRQYRERTNWIPEQAEK